MPAANQVFDPDWSQYSGQVGGAGRDKLYGWSGTDELYGGDDNDLLVGGAGADWLEGGDGDDILMPGPNGSTWYPTTETIDGGAGSDWIWLDRDVENIAIVNLDADDRIFWNGYAVTGGEYMMLDAEFQEFVFPAFMDEAGVIYRYDPTYGSLAIVLPTDEDVTSGGLGIENWSNGDLGITLDLSKVGHFDPSTPATNIVGDGIVGNYNDIAERIASLATPGPFAVPTEPLPEAPSLMTTAAMMEMPEAWLALSGERLVEISGFTYAIA